MKNNYDDIILRNSNHINKLKESHKIKRKAYYDQQACIRQFFDIIMHAAPRKSSSIKSELRKVKITNEEWTRLCSSVNIMLDGFVSELIEKYGCSINEVRIFCICYCGGSNNMIELCLPYKKQSIANLKQQIAHKVMGEHATWNEFISSISGQSIK